MKRLNGIRLPQHKRAEDQQIVNLPLPELVRIPMLMHQGAACVPIVKPEESVKVGQVIGQAEQEDAVPIHASVSGTVTAISEYETGSGDKVPCIEIASDGEQLIADDCVQPEVKKKDDLIAAVKRSGCVGLSGAGDLTYQKLSTTEKIDMLILNGAECEPFLTSDCRMMTEYADDVINGASLIQKLLKIKEVRIGIQTSHPAIVKDFAERCKTLKGFRVCPLPPTYPQGAEKVLIYHCSGRVVPEDQKAEQLGVIVLNVSTCAFIHQYIQTGIPLVERIVTVDGNAVRKPCNVRVPVGTPVKNLLEFAECEFSGLQEILSGGLMMGTSLSDLQSPVLRQQNGLLAIRRKKIRKPTACIRCGRCMEACPMQLMPMELENAYRSQNIAMLQKYHISLCMNCGACSFVCPAHRPLAETNQLAKALLPKA